MKMVSQHHGAADGEYTAGTLGQMARN